MASLTEAILYDGDSRPPALPAGASHRSAAHRLTVLSVTDEVAARLDQTATGG